MSKLGKTFWLAAGAALGAGATYYMLKKDELDLKGHASDLWDTTKEYGEELSERIDEYFADQDEFPATSLSNDPEHS